MDPQQENTVHTASDNASPTAYFSAPIVPERAPVGVDSGTSRLNALDGTAQPGTNPPVNSGQGQDKAAHPPSGLGMDRVRARIRNLYQPRANGQVVETSLRDLLEGGAEPDTQIEFLDDTATVVDWDIHHQKTPGTREVAEEDLANIKPKPPAGWVTHGLGLKAVYTGPGHKLRAIQAAMNGPEPYTAEILTHTRHPKSLRTDKPGARCGPLRYGEMVESTMPMKFSDLLMAEPDNDLLESMELEVGEKYDHEHCPIDPCESRDGKKCVEVRRTHIVCFRCKDKGIRYNDDLEPGYFPLSCNDTKRFRRVLKMAHGYCHWQHAKLVLDALYPQLNPKLRRHAYEELVRLRARDEAIASLAGLKSEKSDQEDGDKINALVQRRLAAVFDKRNNFVMGVGLFLRGDNYRPFTLDQDGAGGLPYCNTPDGRVDKSARSQVLSHRAPDVYPPIFAASSLREFAPKGAIPVQLAAHNPVELLAAPIPETECRKALEAAFPGISYQYLTACIGAAICGRMGNGMIPILACTGPSGASKGQTLVLGSSLLKCPLSRLQVESSADLFNRQIGEASANGGIIHLDEISKVRNAVETTRPLLELQRQHTHRRLYDNHLAQTTLSVGVVITSIAMPGDLVSSPEYARRIAHIALNSVVDWSCLPHNATTWRDLNSTNATIGNSIITHAWKLAQDVNFRFIGKGSFCERLGIGKLGSSEQIENDARLVKLYSLCQNPSVPRLAARYIDLTVDPAKQLLDDIVAPRELKETCADYNRRVTNELKNRDWNKILGIAPEQARIVCDISAHGSKLKMRFRDANVSAPNGKESVNEQLPAPNMNASTDTSPPKQTVAHADIISEIFNLGEQP